MKNRRNYYRILQVQPDAPLEVIRASYRILMRELKQHPDLGGANLNASLLNEAYKVLSNPASRDVYDRELFKKYAKRSERQESVNRRIPVRLSCAVCKQKLQQKLKPGKRCLFCGSPLQLTKLAEIGADGRRVIARVKLDKRILYYSAWPGEAREAKMIDFSPEGMRFFCSERLPPGSVLKIVSTHFDASAAMTNIREEVVGGKRVYSVGVSFLAISFEGSKGLFFSTSA